jgi:hypothetical protein
LVLLPANVAGASCTCPSAASEGAAGFQADFFILGSGGTLEGLIDKTPDCECGIPAVISTLAATQVPGLPSYLVQVCLHLQRG